MISTHDLSQLPDIAALRGVMQALATLDATLAPDWESRYYSFNAGWGPGEMMGSMRDGCGDQWYALFCAAGAALVGLAHESPTFTPGSPKPWVFDGLPEAFHKNLRREPAFDTGNCTFCLWRLNGDSAWSCSAPSQCADGSESLLSILDGQPQRYLSWAMDYFEVELELAPIERVYRHEPLTEALVRQLNPEQSLAELADDLTEIGYPKGSP